MIRGSEEKVVYVDADVENEKTYSYTVIAGQPYRGYASKTATATPKSSIISQMLAPDADASGTLGGVAIDWTMNEHYGGSNNDGSGMVDYFNIYRDGVLVDRIYQSAVEDEVDIWNNNSHSYSWSVLEEVPQPYQPYTWEISAVSPSGVESKRCVIYEEQGAMEEIPSILSHRAWFDELCYDETTGDDSPAICIYAEEFGYGDNIETLDIWRKEGTTAPNTSEAPYASCEKYNGYSSDMHDFEDRNVTKGKTYTYSLQGIDGDGHRTNIYTFTIKAVESENWNEPLNVTFKIVNSGTTARFNWSDWYGKSTDTYKVYRNNTLIKTVKHNESGIYDEDERYIYNNNPGSDGTYIYRVDRVADGITTKGREFKFVRDTTGGDINVLAVPSAPTLTARVSGDRQIVLNWKPSEEGGEPAGFHIYRKDAGDAVTGYRKVPVQRWWGTDEVSKMWGNDRYISIEDGQERAFVDGRYDTSSYYKGDSHLGTIENISWADSELPHEYYITAYNRSGESDPSNVVIFDVHGEDEYGNATPPVNPADEAPSAPVLKKTWIEWQDRSSFSSGFDTWIYGYARVEWEDSGLGGEIDEWTATYAGTHYDEYNPPQKETVNAGQVILDPKIRLGTSDDSPDCSISGFAGDNGDLGRTITATVTARNTAGEATSQSKSVIVRSIPRFYCLPGHQKAVLRWTDLAADDGSTITGWEVWRRPAYGVWSKAADSTALPSPGEYAGTGRDSHQNPVQYYEWTDTGLDNEWKYEYKVVAKCDDNIDRSSVVREVTPRRSSATEEPGAPTNLTAKVINGEIVFTWTKPDHYENVYEYQIVSLEQNSGDDSPTWYNRGRTAYGGDSTGTTYCPTKAGTYTFAVYDYAYINGERVPDDLLPYEIEGYDNMTSMEKLNAQYPTHSNVITVTVTQTQIGQQSSDYPDKPAPSAAIGDGQITLTWAACSGATYYTVERENNNYPDIPDVTIVSVPGKQTYTFTDTEALPGVKYRYIVTARNDNRSIYTDLYATATGKTHDEKAAEQINALIAALPDEGDISRENADEVRGQVSEIEEIIDSLTDAQKALIDPEMLERLDAVNDALANICDHVWGTPVYTWATDYSTVTGTRTCELNAKHKLTETVAATGVVTKEATCLAKGETTYTSETFTKEGFEVQTKTVANIPLADHSWGDWETVEESTCTEYGTEKRVCSVCGAEETRDKDYLLEHTLGDVQEGTDPTCTEDGQYDYWVCSVCGGFFVEVEGEEDLVQVTDEELVIPALGHDWSDWEPYAENPSTCVYEGQDVRTCSRCGLTEYRDAALLAHTTTLIQDAVAPTCEESGLLACWQCSVCGGLFADADGLQQFDSLDDTYLEPTGHAWKAPAWSWTGSDTKGYTAAKATFTCKNDKTHVEAVDADLTSAKITGGTKYTATVEFDGAVFTTSKTVYADIPIYRLYNPKTAEHLWTSSANEKTVLSTKYGWRYEGVGWYAPKTGKSIYRLYNKKTGQHLYTGDANEIKVLTTKYGWVYDNNKKPLFYSGGSVAVYRVYNPKLKVGSHHLTTDKNEYNILPKYGWRQEGVSLYATRIK